MWWYARMESNQNRTKLSCPSLPRPPSVPHKPFQAYMIDENSRLPYIISYRNCYLYTQPVGLINIMIPVVVKLKLFYYSYPWWALCSSHCDFDTKIFFNCYKMIMSRFSGVSPTLNTAEAHKPNKYPFGFSGLRSTKLPLRGKCSSSMLR